MHRRPLVNRGLAFVIALVLGGSVSAIEACNDATDDLPPYSTNRGYTQPIPVGTSTDAGVDGDGDAEAEADAPLEADADADVAVTTTAAMGGGG